jgi:uncharacterized protein GlcG (DUF336 family)
MVQRCIVSSFLLMGLMCVQGFAAACTDVPDVNALKAGLDAAQSMTTTGLGGKVGGLFNGTRMWAAVVNRDGEVCAFATSTTDATQVWPGSQAIAKAKAYAANAFSLDVLPLSTASLYTLTQPGHSLASLGQSNLFNPASLIAPGGAGGVNQIQGGLIFFGGGVPLYKNGKIVGGLGVSGDTSCADHEISKRVRHFLQMNPPGGFSTDDIHYTTDGADLFTHPLCVNTWRNGVFVGNEPVSASEIGPLVERITTLEQVVAQLQQQVQELASRIGP